MPVHPRTGSVTGLVRSVVRVIPTGDRRFGELTISISSGSQIRKLEQK